MTGLARVVLFAAALALLFAGAALAGSALDPDVLDGSGGEAAGHSPMEEETMEQNPTSAKEAGAGKHEAASEPAGLAVEAAGLRLIIDRTRLAAGAREELRFRVVDEDGTALREFQTEHERRMHLIVVRRDLTGFQHLHPRMSSDGTWAAPLELEDAGSYRVFADFKSNERSHTLGADMHVAGAFEPAAVPPVSDRGDATDGYEARLTEHDGELRFAIFAGGRRVRDIEPYLGARGHLVALREGDLAFLHVHPESEATEGADIRFRAEYPSPGR